VQLLTYRKAKQRKRSKTLVMALLPALLFIGMMGLFLYLMDNHYGRPTKKTLGKETRVFTEDNVTFIPAIFEDRQKVISE
jgi:hypothetical protein